MTYLDTSAGMKLLHTEQESRALTAWLGARPDVRFTAARLLYTELHRVGHAYGIGRAMIDALLCTVEIVEIDDELLVRAAHLPAAPHQRLGSLDAVHLAAAQRAEVIHLLTYDDRLATAAEFHGMTVHAPA